MSDNSEKDQGLLNETALAEKQTLKYARDLSLIYQEEKARRKDLEAAHEKMRAVVDSMTDGMLAVDNAFTIIEANRVAGQFLKTNPTDLLQTSLSLDRCLARRAVISASYRIFKAKLDTRICNRLI